MYDWTKPAENSDCSGHWGNSHSLDVGECYADTDAGSDENADCSWMEPEKLLHLQKWTHPHPSCCDDHDGSSLRGGNKKGQQLSATRHRTWHTNSTVSILVNYTAE